VGVVNTLIDMSVYFLLTMSAFFYKYYFFAQAISFTCGVVNSLLMNKRFTFKEKGAMGAKRVSAFFAINVLSLGVSLAALYLGRDVLMWGNAFGKVLSAVCSMGVNFTRNKLLVFKD
jgi:putative flippase GtrA